MPDRRKGALNPSIFALAGPGFFLRVGADGTWDTARPSQFSFVVLGLPPHVTLIELRLALISYQD